jgi:hypothetical protein
MPTTFPESPECALALVTESPERAVAEGLDVALPELPVLPELAIGFAEESPEVAEPLAVALESALPELPPGPLSPEMTVGSELALPEFPLSPLLPELPDSASSLARIAANDARTKSTKSFVTQPQSVLASVATAWPVEPVSPVSVLPESTAGSELAVPVFPELPPFPVVAFDVDAGLDDASPVLPAVPVAVAVDEPVSPVIAVPVESAVALPVLPPVVVAVAAPVSPDRAVTFASPWCANAMPTTAPESPDVAVACVIESPVVAFALGFEVASPELPVFPDIAIGSEDELPEVADPFAVASDLAFPESPPCPELPDSTVGSDDALPESPELPLFPESPDAAAVPLPLFAASMATA